ncbi:hypothetical protein MANES_09G009350v8, partial [Manihot esculenta]
MRKSSGGSDLKRKLKKSRSVKAGRSSIILSDDSDKSPDLLKATSCSESKVPFMKNCYQMLDSSVHKATCSSVLKDSKFPDHLELQSGRSESEGISAMKVCTYSYCSLHGHRPSSSPPLKRFIAMRRRFLKTQRSIRLEIQSFHREKRCSNTKKGMKKASKMEYLTDTVVVEPALESRAITSIRKVVPPEDDLNGEGTHGRDDKETRNSKSVDKNKLLYLKEKQQLSELMRDKSKEHCTDKKEEGTDANYSVFVSELHDESPEATEGEFTPHEESKFGSADDQSVAGTAILDQEHLTKQPDNNAGESNSSKAEQRSILDPKEPCLHSANSATVEGNKPKPPSWSNLKKLILLKRFIKALEKVKKLNPREPQILLLNPEEAEKIHLKHQDIEDRKNADDWMLDYALQQVVAKLTPARKRKVQLLVEAFET